MQGDSEHARLHLGVQNAQEVWRTMLARVGQAWGLFWSSVSITMSASRKPSLVVRRYFMQCASLMQPFSSFGLPLHQQP